MQPTARRLRSPLAFAALSLYTGVAWRGVPESDVENVRCWHVGPEGSQAVHGPDGQRGGCVAALDRPGTSHAVARRSPGSAPVSRASRALSMAPKPEGGRRLGFRLLVVVYAFLVSLAIVPRCRKETSWAHVRFNLNLRGLDKIEWI